MYADAFLDHFRRPRGQGSLADATHGAERGDPACGDELALDLRIEDGRIVAARFRARGCMGAIATGSALASLLPGRAAHPDALTRAELEAELGAIPQSKRHAIRLGLEVFRDALGQGRSSSPPPS